MSLTTILVRWFKETLLLLSLVLFVFVSFGCDEDTMIPASDTTWTLMFYFNADNNLEEALFYDLNELESVNLKNSNITVLALFDRNSNYYFDGGNWDSTRLYKIEYDPAGLFNLEIVSTRLSSSELGLQSDSETELDLGDYRTVEQFIDFSQSNYPANHYALIISSHGDGWRAQLSDLQVKSSFTMLSKSTGYYKAIGPDETAAGDGIISNSQIALAMENKVVDIIGFDSCLQGMVETAYDFSSVASIMVASQEVEPGTGWCHDGWITHLRNAYDRSPQEVSRFMVESYQEFYEYFEDGQTTLSAIDLEIIPILVDSLDETAAEIMERDAQSIWEIRLDSQSFSVTDTDHLDLYDYLMRVNQDFPSDTIQGCMDYYNNSILYEWHDTSSNSDVQDASGLAVYFPRNPVLLDSDYNSANLAFAADTRWDEMVNWVLANGATLNEEEDDAGDSFALAQNISFNTQTSVESSNYIYVDWDIDVYKIHVLTNGTIGIKLEDVAFNGDYDLFLFSPKIPSNWVAASYAYTEGKDEFIIYQTETGEGMYNEQCDGMNVYTQTYGNGVGTGIYYVVVNSYEGSSQTKPYKLTFSEFNQCGYTDPADIE